MAHKHEWHYIQSIMNDEGGMERGFYCTNNPSHTLTMPEAALRLNAVEHLPEGHARTAASLIKGHSVKDNLKEYAKVLKGDKNNE